jgi:signal transduction histidine kinase
MKVPAASAAHVRRVLWPMTAVIGLSTVAVVRSDPDYSIAGDSLGGALALLLPGGALVAAGLVEWAKRPSSRSGRLLLAAGVSWWLPAWANPGIGWAPAFTVGLIGWALCPAFVAHAASTYPSGRLASRAERLLVTGTYANSVLILGVLPALTFDPAASGCSRCPANLLGVLDLPDATEAAYRVGRALGIVLSVALAAVIVQQLLAVSPAIRRVKAPVSLAAAAYLGLVAADNAHQLSRHVQGDDVWDRRMWMLQGVTLTVLAAGVAWAWVRAWRTRSDIARLIIELAAAPPAGGLQNALARMLGDDSLRLAYPLSGGELVDAHGEPLTDNRPASELVRGDTVLAVLTHRPGLLDDPATTEEVAQAASLVLDNERLDAELSAQLAHLRASRQRIVAAGDAERRRLERDLHDGAQQGLVTLLLRLRLLTNSSELGEPRALALATQVEEELEQAIADLRAIAHGIFPAVLADEGLAQAVDALAESADIPITLRELPDDTGLDGRLNPTIEAVAYFVVAESIERSAAQQAAVSIAKNGEALSVDVELRGVEGHDDGWLLDLQDRVGAIGGRLDTSRGGTGRLLLRAEIPCAS